MSLETVDTIFANQHIIGGEEVQLLLLLFIDHRFCFLVFFFIISNLIFVSLYQAVQLCQQVFILCSFMRVIFKPRAITLGYQKRTLMNSQESRIHISSWHQFQPFWKVLNQHVVQFLFLFCFFFFNTHRKIDTVVFFFC